MSVLHVVLLDQLSHKISSLKNCDKKNDIILLCELNEEFTYVKHHKKKIVLLISAMRHFSVELKNNGYNVEYVSLEDKKNTGGLRTEIERALKNYKSKKVVITHPAEYRILDCLNKLRKDLSVQIDIIEDDRFLCSIEFFNNWSDGRENLRMEYFYRELRKKYSVLMEGEQPIGGKWNYDASNRKPPKEGLDIPEKYTSKPDKITQEVIELVEKKYSLHFGDLEPFHFAVDRKGALKALQEFITKKLYLFGDYQDAMLEGEAWMYHSHISFYLNCGLLLPMECIQKAEQSYHEDKSPLNAVEGFIRQILGWREYIRGIYWLKMPDYEKSNFFNAKRKLPSFYWNSKTEMNCLRNCVKETKENAYAHHIQRLMVLGNFALLAGIDPKDVNEWFLIVYADAYQWVELPNVTGMILFADGGYLASKPYASGGAYINKMSNYCKNCKYKVTEKNGSEACPFNYLYWNFLAENRQKLSSNHRLRMMYSSYDKMDSEKKKNIQKDSLNFLNSLS